MQKYSYMTTGLNNTYRFFNSDNELIEEGTLNENEVPDGEYIRLDYKNYAKEHGYYVNGIENGEYKITKNSNGYIIEAGNYINGIKHVSDSKTSALMSINNLELQKEAIQNTNKYNSDIDFSFYCNFFKNTNFKLNSVNICYLDYYFPKSRDFNPYDILSSRRILDLKNSNREAIAYYTDLAENIFNENIAIMAVPSHLENTHVKALIEIIKNVSSTGLRINASNCLLRRQSLIDKSKVGRRDFDKEYNSLSVQNLDTTKDFPVLIIDAVSTSGTSLLACKKILEVNGINKVACFAFTKTIIPQKF